MMVRPIFRPIWCLRAIPRMTASPTGNTVPAKSRAILYFGHSVILTDFVANLVYPLPRPRGHLLRRHQPLSAPDCP